MLEPYAIIKDCVQDGNQVFVVLKGGGEGLV